jgi:hypothetical protein
VQAAASLSAAYDRVFTIVSGVTVTLRDLTIRYGGAPNYYDGGGLNNAGTMTLINSTVSGNTAGLGGGGIGNLGTLTLTNSIVASNAIGRDCYHNDFWSSIISQGSNLDSDGSCQLTAPTDLPGTDPQLGPLQDNGGPTFTQALLPGSPAIDTIPWGTNGCGTTVISDQR